VIFRNIDISPDAPPETWGFEGVLAALRRGDLKEWHQLYVALANDSQGRFRKTLEEALDVLSADELRPGLVNAFRRLLDGYPTVS